MMKNGVYFIVIALLVAELFKILIYANQMTCDVIFFWTQSDEKSQKKWNMSHNFFCIELKLEVSGVSPSSHVGLNPTTF